MESHSLSRLNGHGDVHPSPDPESHKDVNMLVAKAAEATSEPPSPGAAQPQIMPRDLTDSDPPPTRQRWERHKGHRPATVTTLKLPQSNELPNADRITKLPTEL